MGSGDVAVKHVSLFALRALFGQPRQIAAQALEGRRVIGVDDYAYVELEAVVVRLEGRAPGVA
jgi:hypothetical protein